MKNIDLSHLGDGHPPRLGTGYAWRRSRLKTAMIAGSEPARGKPAISFSIISPPEAGL